MRVIWNGMCDPTLHLIAIALLLAGMGTVSDISGSSGRESGPIRRCSRCIRLHYGPELRCVDPDLIVASRNTTD